MPGTGTGGFAPAVVATETHGVVVSAAVVAVAAVVAAVVVVVVVVVGTAADVVALAAVELAGLPLPLLPPLLRWALG